MTVFNSLGSNYDLATALRTLCAFGSASRRQRLISYLEKRYGGGALLTYKGRDALRLALESIPRKGAVAINGYTCLAVYDAVIESGCTPRHLDIAERSLDFPFTALQKAVEDDPSLVAVVVQNTLGFPSDIAPIERLCKERGLFLIEDLAHSIGTRYPDGREAGTVGDCAVLSFSQDKVIDSVSGGALIVRNQALCKPGLHKQDTVSIGTQLKDRLYPVLTWKVRMLYPLGIGKLFHALLKKIRVLSRPFDGVRSVRSLPHWYCDPVLRQFEQLDTTQAHRCEVARVYAKRLGACSPLRLSFEHASAIRFPLLVEDRDSLIEHLRRAGVHVSDIWYDAPIAPQKYLHHTSYAGECPRAEQVSKLMVNLPTHRNISLRQAEAIAESVAQWLRLRASEYRTAIVEDEREWESFVAQLRPHSFLQSWKWGQLHQYEGARVHRIGVYRAAKLVAAASCIKVDARRGAFLLCPHGPLIAAEVDETVAFGRIIERAETIARTERCAFIRVCPLAENSAAHTQLYRSFGFRDAPIHMHPELAWMLDVTKPEEQLLKDMRKTTRYLIRTMEKKGVEITQSTDQNDVERFWQVYRATVERQQFTPFSKAHLLHEFELFSKNGQVTFFFGSYQGQTIAAAIIVFYNGQAFYHHSGSLHTFRDVNASYLLQWRVIQEAKRRGCTLYNFWGISPADRQRHPWAGLSLFKKGFGGFAEAYIHAQDKPLAQKYWINYLVETARRIRRGL